MRAELHRICGVDLTDPDTYLSGMPYDALRELRRCAPVAWHPYKDGPGFLALTGYDEILAVSRDSTTWSSQAAGVFFDVPGPADEFQLALMMLTMDPPRHTKLRSLVSKGFTPRRVARLNDHVADMARAIVDDVAELCPRIAIMGQGKILKDGEPGKLTVEMNGRLWSRIVSQAELGGIRRDHTVLSTRFRSGRTEVRILADEKPEGATAAVAELEDVYFGVLVEHGLRENLE